MLAFLPTPATDEHFSSVVSRLIHRSRMGNSTVLHQLGLFATRPFSLVPSQVVRLLAEVPDGHPWRSPRRLFLENTCAAFYTFFSDAPARAAVIDKLSHSGLKNPYLTLGIARTGLQPYAHVSCCRACIEQDIQTLGHPCLYTYHQIPCVAVCFKHQCTTQGYCQDCARAREFRGTWQMAGQCTCTSPLPVERLPSELEASLPIFAYVAKLAYQAQTCQDGPEYQDRRPMQTLRRRLERAGFKGVRGLDSRALAAALVAKYTAPVLEHFHAQAHGPDGDPAAWIYKMFQCPNGGSSRNAVRLLLVAGVCCEDLHELWCAPDVPSTTSPAKAPQGYQWDERDQLVNISNLVTNASFKYDSHGRRIARTLGGATTAFNYDGDNFIQELDAVGRTGSITANLITGGIDQHFMRQTFTTDAQGNKIPNLSWVMAEANNSTVVQADASGNVQKAFQYAPYGSPMGTTGTSTDSQRYTGREDDGTGVYYYRARYYRPDCMRFISEDPLGWASGQVNNYAYVGGDPISRTDPSGLLFGGLVNAGECFGASSAQYWANKQVATGNPLYAIPGVLASLWTPATSDYTFAVLATVSGLAVGIRTGMGVSGDGIEFSHAIPARFGGPRSIWNGNWVTEMEHIMSDPWRYRFTPRSWKYDNPMPDPIAQTWMRLPNSLLGGAFGGFLGASVVEAHNQSGAKSDCQ